MAHGTRMNERWTADRSGPPDVVGDESSRYFRKVVKVRHFLAFPLARRSTVSTHSGRGIGETLNRHRAAATSTSVMDGRSGGSGGLAVTRYAPADKACEKSRYVMYFV